MQRIYFESHDMQDKVYILHHRFLEKKPTGHIMDFNWHESLEIAYITDGQGCIICDSQTYHVKKGDIFIYNSNEVHRCFTDSRMEYYCLIVNSQFLSSNDIHVTETYFEHLIQDQTLRQIYGNVINEIEEANPFQKTGIRTRILELFLYLLRNHLSQFSRRDDKAHTFSDIKASIEFIHRQYASKLTLEQIANVAGLSKYHFAREFKKATGTTVTTYLNMIRCKNAKHLIVGQGYSVQDAALSCGFTNASFFSKTFFSVMGYLPSTLKQQP